MRNMLSVRFYIQRQRLDARKQAPIIIRIKLQDAQRDVSSGLRIEPHQWNAKYGLVQGKSDQAKQINQLLELSRNRLLQIFTQLSYGAEVLIDDIVAAFHGKPQRKEHQLLTLVREHNQHIRKRIGIDYTDRIDPILALRYE